MVNRTGSSAPTRPGRGQTDEAKDRHRQDRADWRGTHGQQTLLDATNRLPRAVSGLCPRGRSSYTVALEFLEPKDTPSTLIKGRQ